MKITRVVFKIGFFIIALIMPFYNNWQYYKSVNRPVGKPVIQEGVYNVNVFVVNKDTLQAPGDSLRWKDIIFENIGRGSIATSDTSFVHVYNRAYFRFTTDTVKHTIDFMKYKFMADGKAQFTLSYTIPDTNTIRLWGKQKNDSLFVKLKKMNRHFQLAERQFHWLSESNR